MTDPKHQLYDNDFYAWTQWQAEALANYAIDELDGERLQEEIVSLGRQKYRELVSCLTVLIGDLLK